jgi:hypothetical protein
LWQGPADRAFKAGCEQHVLVGFCPPSRPILIGLNAVVKLFRDELKGLAV